MQTITRLALTLGAAKAWGLPTQTHSQSKASTLHPDADDTHAGRRLEWRFCIPFWDCQPPTPGPHCAPCATPCPVGFTYEEDCAGWRFWKSDTTRCVPDVVQPEGAVAANTDVGQRGTCSYSFLANGEGKFGGEPAACPSGYTDLGVEESTDNCCQPPIWARGGRRLEEKDAEQDNRRGLLLAPYSCDDPITKPYGFFKTRKCIPEAPTYVFKISEPTSLCPTWSMQGWQTSFDTCAHCGDDGRTLGEPGSASACWLPYAKGEDGRCFAYDATEVGWWKVARSADDEEHRDDLWEAVKGGTEQLVPPYSPGGIEW